MGPAVCRSQLSAARRSTLQSLGLRFFRVPRVTHAALPAAPLHRTQRQTHVAVEPACDLLCREKGNFARTVCLAVVDEKPRAAAGPTCAAEVLLSRRNMMPCTAPARFAQ
ncbi:hypothetical protein GUJ93_ZPchr0015g6614 [Zizania palustris]|uniref:Uncharacterized protein n=1 Tax=Zizania palustris TaxID=103762 RepID=A0A8J5TD82_ZIZPA|nr:hypothetical protein GUJ93_ZPchr0015g6614 [Zizania palustris]